MSGYDSHSSDCAPSRFIRPLPPKCRRGVRRAVAPPSWIQSPTMDQSTLPRLLRCQG